ncbi:MAG TPA: hypothetical protein VHW72_09035 [Candidatus Angelobacter sp.]|nr:hypothetical protein [Candidatus Angelobacter sp.]
MKILLVLLLSSHLFAVQNASKLSPDAKEAMIAEIAGGRSLLEAGETGDPDFIAPLRSYFTTRWASSFNRRQAVMALARLGDKRAQQQIVCAFYGDDKIAMQDAADTDLPYVGGWFAIRLYRYLLSPEADKRFWKAKKPESSDLAYVSPAVWALMQLPKVAPNPPLAPFVPGAGDPKRVPQQEGTVWLDWIQEHQTSLQQLTPTGEGIDFSGKSCKHFKPYPHSKRE